MAKTGQSGLEGIAASLPRENRGLPPVERWNPPFCGDIDMRIAADGTWFYQKTPIGRPALVKLFASVLKREGDKYFLVTPVEKVGLIVEEVPFLAVELKVEQDARRQVLNFRTNVDDWVTAGPGHALRFEPQPANGGLKPYLHVRRELWAKVTRVVVLRSGRARRRARRWRKSNVRCVFVGRVFRDGGSQRGAGVRLMERGGGAFGGRILRARARAAHARGAGRNYRSQHHAGAWRS